MKATNASTMSFPAFMGRGTRWGEKHTCHDGSLRPKRGRSTPTTSLGQGITVSIFESFSETCQRTPGRRSTAPSRCRRGRRSLVLVLAAFESLLVPEPWRSSGETILKPGWVPVPA